MEFEGRSRIERETRQRIEDKDRRFEMNRDDENKDRDREDRDRVRG